MSIPMPAYAVERGRIARNKDYAKYFGVVANLAARMSAAMADGADANDYDAGKLAHYFAQAMGIDVPAVLEDVVREAFEQDDRDNAAQAYWEQQHRDAAYIGGGRW